MTRRLMGLTALSFSFLLAPRLLAQNLWDGVPPLLTTCFDKGWAFSGGEG